MRMYQYLATPCGLQPPGTDTIRIASNSYSDAVSQDFHPLYIPGFDALIASPAGSMICYNATSIYIFNIRIRTLDYPYYIAGEQKIHYHACAEGVANDFVGVVIS